MAIKNGLQQQLCYGRYTTNLKVRNALDSGLAQPANPSAVEDVLSAIVDVRLGFQHHQPGAELIEEVWTDCVNVADGAEVDRSEVLGRAHCGKCSARSGNLVVAVLVLIPGKQRMSAGEIVVYTNFKNVVVLRPIAAEMC